MQPLIATKALSHGGERHEAGARFLAKPQHARVLVAIGKAQHAPEPEPAAQPPAPAPVEQPGDQAPAPEQPPAAAPVAPVVEAKAEPKAGKGTYNRRDLKAKE